MSAAQLGDTPLERIEFSRSDGGPSGDALPPAASAGTLYLVSARVAAPPTHQSGWRPLLAAAVPRGKQLHTVHLQHCDFGRPGQLVAQLGPQQLAQLRQLQLSDCRGLLGMAGVVQALLGSAPQLQGLKFMVTDFGPLGPPDTQHLHSFPTAIFSHPALTRAEVLSMADEQWDAFKLPPLPDPREQHHPPLPMLC